MTTQIPLNTVLNTPVNPDTGEFSNMAVRFFQQLIRAVNMFIGTTTAQIVVATAGSTITMNPTAATLYLTPAGVLATLTVAFPPQPQDGLIVTLKSTKAITALTLTSATPNTILDPITTLAANGFARYQFILEANIWIRIG